MELLGGYPLDNSLLDFFVYLLREETAEKQWEVWLHKPITVGFEEFKKQSTRQARVASSTMSDQEAIAHAENILKTNKFKEEKVGV